MWIYLFPLLVLVPLVQKVDTAPFTACLQNVVGNVFIADDVDRCIFYWCLDGVMVTKRNGGGKEFPCMNMKGTAASSMSQRGICTVDNPTCTTDRATTKSPGKEITQVIQGYHMLNGIEQKLSSTRDVNECIVHCTSSDSCYAVDFDIRGSRCFLHTRRTACRSGRKKRFCTHYKFTRCDSTTATATPTAATTTPTIPTPAATVTSASLPSFIRRYPGHHLFGGLVQTAIVDGYDCVMKCSEALSCAGADYNKDTQKCFHHDITTECKTLNKKPECVHYRLTDACPVTVTDSPTTTTVSTTTTSAPTTTTDIPTPPTGYIEVVPGVHLLDGILLLTGATEQQCLDACLMTSFCLALDYDTVQKACWAHNSTTHCSAAQTKADCRHYRRIPCLAGVSNFINEVRTKFHIQGGSESCTGCSLVECLQTCLNSLGVCQAVDYDERNRGCYIHTAFTVCQTFVAKDYCTHYTRANCPLQPSVTSPPSGGGPPTGGIPTPQGNFMHINFVGPSVLLSGWSAYPGMNIVGGELIAGPSVDGDTCVAVCQASSKCYSVDFNSRDGTCWGHPDLDLKCDFLSPLNEVYHLKKPTVCTYFSNTMIPYSPSPFAVAP